MQAGLCLYNVPEMRSTVSLTYNGVPGGGKKKNKNKNLFQQDFDPSHPFLKAISISARMPGLYPNDIATSNLP